MPHFLASNPLIRFTITALTDPPAPVPIAFVEQMLHAAVEQRMSTSSASPKDALAPLRGTTVVSAAAMQDAAATFGLRTGGSMQQADLNAPPSDWTVQVMASSWWRWASPLPHAVIGQVLPSAGASPWTVEWPSVTPLFRGEVWLEFTVTEVQVT